MNETYTRCDGCGRFDCVNAPSAKAAAQTLKREGWLLGKVGAMCPTCVARHQAEYAESLYQLRTAASRY